MKRKATTKKKPICFVFGTRPEIIKLAPIIKECIRTKTQLITIHTGQHYSKNMDSIFFQSLRFPRIDYNLHVGSGSHAVQTAHMMIGIEKILEKEKPKYVIVQGDTNSVLAGALVAAKLQIPIGHVEGGLRSYDRTMPEELNRVLTGAVTALHFVPTEKARENLLKEGVRHDMIHVTGNTAVDAIYQNVQLANNKSQILTDLNLKKTKFALVTVHRPDNTDSKTNMANILISLENIAEKYRMHIVWPMHPRTKKQIEIFELEQKLHTIPNVHILEPVGFFDMIRLQSKSTVIISDSGGIQEEACILGIPLVTLRNNTERPESVEVGSNILAGNVPERICQAVDDMLNIKKKWENPFGDGTAAKKIVKLLNNVNETEKVGLRLEKVGSQYTL